MLYDLIIIGSGPAGCAASIYASRYKLKNIILGKTFGGTISYAHKVDNYPGFLAISGVDLMQEVERHVKGLGTEIIYDPVNKIEKVPDNTFKVLTDSEKIYESRTVLVATGTERKKLNIPGEKELIGKGVSYCVTCDAAFYRGKTVALVGGSDAACSGAIHLADFAQKVYLIYRKDKLRAEPFWLSEWEQLVGQGKGITLYNTNVLEVISQANLANQSATVWDKIAAIKLDKEFMGSNILKIDGLFIEIGGVPGAQLLQSLAVEIDEQNYVKTSVLGETNIPGLFAAGDLTSNSKPMQQVITAMAWGAQAASGIYKYLKGKQAPRQISE